MFVKKTKIGSGEKDKDTESNYETCSNFLNNEHEQMLEDHMKDIGTVNKSESSNGIREESENESPVMIEEFSDSDLEESNEKNSLRDQN